MGAEHSRWEGAPQTLEALDLKSVVKYMKSKQCKNIFVMVCILLISVYPCIDELRLQLGAGWYTKSGCVYDIDDRTLRS